MKKVIVFLLFIVTAGFSSQKEDAFGVGEYFKFRIHYGIVNAGYATLDMQESTRNGKKVFHAVGKGWTVGMSRFFFKVDDTYESYFDKGTCVPVQAVRKIDEGGYVRNQEAFFDQPGNRVLVKDYKRNKEKTYVTPDNTLDVVSMFYYLRNHPSIDKMKVGQAITVDMFFDDEVIKFKLKYIGQEDISTKFGTIPTMIFRPLVQSGRVFKEEESLTVWISDDDNKIPVRIKASLAVGSIKADLESFKGLKHSFKVKAKP
ncbi:DUF3108 domain-containing protein [Flavobacterium sp. MAH-1]|uniref:DUF3108 domain-containing protein n=1 Tax=Flavobacterium agri TaxID=2743471 RepID=A0A7Y8Y2H9_9FLAO|nr:DUF3108 domain-containing protein [Flavobacterium agri]NUY81298.1 DUF3108 domain-containing protein [Flavobacterium agri]NYA71322.1 DUF3108 domain-containing protein [Flavobacterium agri]